MILSIMKKNAWEQAASGLLWRAWNESCWIFLDFLNSNPSSPIKSVSSLFAWHENQSKAGNLPHIHAMIKIIWNSLTNQDKQFVNDCVRASVLDIVKVHELQCLVDEGLLNDVCEVSKITNLAKKYYHINALLDA